MSDDLRHALSTLHPSPVDVDPVAYGQDWTRVATPAPLAVVQPQTVQEVQSIVRWARTHRVALVPSGGRTGLSGGAVAARGELVVSMDRMRAITEFRAADQSLTVEAGVTTQEVQEAARHHGLFYPVDFASRGSSQIGGNVATNAGGIRVLRYGLTRERVLGLKIVTGTGELLDLNRGLVKNATGYDLRHLVIGSEGTLGIVVEATLRLVEAPPPQQVMMLALSGLEAIMPVFASLRRRLTLSAFEFLTDKALRHVVAAGARRPFALEAPVLVLAEFDANEDAAVAAFVDAQQAGHVVDAVVSQSDAQAAELWRVREGITESLARFTPYKNDIAVRVGDVPAFLVSADALFAREYPDWEVVWFGHIGDGNLHISILPPPGHPPSEFRHSCERVTELLGNLLAVFGGSISAEHGVGLWKKPVLHCSRPAMEIALMRGVKSLFDPDGLMNPGKIFDPATATSMS